MTGIPYGDGRILVSGPYGLKLFSTLDDYSLTLDLALFGEYERDFSDYIYRHVREGMTVIDVGANIGLHAILAAKLGAYVIAYECNPPVAELLRLNARINYVEDHLRVRPYAAGAAEGRALLRVPGNFHGSAVISSWDPDVTRMLTDIDVEVRPLDCEFKREDYAHLVKIDAEGAEPDVLDGLAAAIERGRVGVIALEYRSDVSNDKLAAATRWLAKLRSRHGVTFSVPSDPREIPLHEVTDIAMYSNLLVRFPHSPIVHEEKETA